MDVDPLAPLVIMVGAPGSGKSTWAASRFRTDQLFGLDMFRRLLTGDVTDQDASAAAADMLNIVLAYRMDTARTTVVDATNADWSRRDALRYNAQRRRRPVVAVRMHTPLAVCLDRNAKRTTRPWDGANDQPVPEHVVRRIHAAVDGEQLSAEEFDVVVHVHPDNHDEAYAQYPGRGHTTDWVQDLLRSERWGRRITVLDDPLAPLPWRTIDSWAARG